MEGQLEKETDKETFSVFLKRVCDEKKLKLEDHDATVMIDICPEGHIECGYEDCFVSIAAQTSVVRPESHAFVYTVSNEIISGSQILLGVDGSTGYYTNRNFESLRYKYFYRWLKDIQGCVLDHIDGEKELCISQPQEYYHPVYREDFVVTLLSYIHRDDLQTRDVEDLADNFFVRSDRKYTTCYYRNCAMILPWKECCFACSFMNEYTDEIASSILGYLEAVYEKGDPLSLPMDAYRSICTTIHREILIQHADELKVAHLGCRNGVASYPFGSWSIPTHGCGKKSFDETTQTMYFMALYKDVQESWRRMIKTNTYTFKKEIPTSPRKLEKPVGVMDAFSPEKETVICKGIAENLDEYYIAVVQTNYGKDTLFLECIVRGKQNIATLREWCQGIKHHVTISDELHS